MPILFIIFTHTVHIVVRIDRSIRRVPSRDVIAKEVVHHIRQTASHIRIHTTHDTRSIVNGYLITIKFNIKTWFHAICSNAIHRRRWKTIWTANLAWNNNIFSWRLKLNKESECRMLNGKLFQTETADCLKPRDSVIIRVRVTYNSFWSEDRKLRSGR